MPMRSLKRFWRNRGARLRSRAKKPGAETFGGRLYDILSGGFDVWFGGWDFPFIIGNSFPPVWCTKFRNLIGCGFFAGGVNGASLACSAFSGVSVSSVTATVRPMSSRYLMTFPDNSDRRPESPILLFRDMAVERRRFVLSEKKNRFVPREVAVATLPMGLR